MTEHQIAEVVVAVTNAIGTVLCLVGDAIVVGAILWAMLRKDRP